MKITYENSFNNVEIINDYTEFTRRIEAYIDRCEVKGYATPEEKKDAKTFKDAIKEDRNAFSEAYAKNFPFGAVIGFVETPFIIMNKEIIQEIGFSEREMVAFLWHEWHHATYHTFDEIACDEEAYNHGYEKDLKSGIYKYLIKMSKILNLDIDMLIIGDLISPQYRHRTYLYDFLTKEGKEIYDAYKKEIEKNLSKA